ncbi:MAG: lytic transglycosylase domain-containing protein [Prevotella sp.]|nr:lytic transglycosylase domain-containing protein [Prevotella sp.]MBQ8114775.1 lytic transglycosylase domain-containing protein [Prevotella sp.]MBR4268526.1 lytic transglycosylase domain-containing protein [Prevotella sp.]
MIFSKIAKVTVLTTVLTFEAFAVQGRENGSKNYDWDPLMDAITHVESRGDSRAVSGRSCGAMQITPILVQQCNIILKERGDKRRYTLNDRFSVKKSREMFVLIQSYYNPTNNVEKAIRIWNGGPRYKVRSTQGYYKRVMRAYNN